MASKAVLAAVLLTTVAVAGEAEAFGVKHAAGGEIVRWRRESVAWTVDRSVRRVEGGEEAVAAAIDAWTQRAGAPALSVGATNAALKPGFDGTSAVFFAPDGYAPAGAALAVTLLSFDEQTGEVLDADIVLNGRYELGRVDDDSDDRHSKRYDVARIVAHEVGHALGLADEPARRDALMYPFVARAKVLRASPASDDVAGLRALYGSATGAAAETARGEASDAKAAGCTGGIVASSSPGPLPVTAAVAVGLVMVALALARGGRRGGRAAAGCSMLAAAGLVVLPPAARTPAPSRAAFDAKAVVKEVRTSAIDGVFRSTVELETTTCARRICPAAGRAIVWGGTIDGVRQVVGGVRVPAPGEHVSVVLDDDPNTPPASLERSAYATIIGGAE